MNSNNGKKILKAISDLEDEISSFGDTVANMVSTDQDDRFFHKKTHEIPQAQFEPSARDDYLNETSEVNHQSEPLDHDFQSLAANLRALRAELDNLKAQFAQQSRAIVPAQNNLSEQIHRLVMYLEQKFNEVNLNQQRLLSIRQNYEEKPHVPKQNEQLDWSVDNEIPTKPTEHATDREFNAEASEQSEENSIRALGDHYTNFLNELRDDCVKRIKNAIATESEKIIGRDDLSLKELFEVITYIIEKEKARFQNTLRDINERIFSALDDRVSLESVQQQGEPAEPEVVSAPKETLTDAKVDRKQLIKQMSEIQERLNNNLIKQYQFYGIKKS